MSTPTRRALLGMARNALAAGAVGAMGVCLVDTAEAMPAASHPGVPEEPSHLATRAQWWGAPPPPRRGRPSPLRRRWKCYWHRGHRHCGWRWG